MLSPALEFCKSACVTEMRGDYNFEKRCNGKINQSVFTQREVENVMTAV